MKKILFAASECVPFIKTGGLADVCGALPKEFDKNEWDVRVVIPNYSCIPDKFRSKFEYVAHFYMSTGSYITNKYVGMTIRNILTVQCHMEMSAMILKSSVSLTKLYCPC